MKTSTESLKGKVVMDENGMMLGLAKNVSANFRTGELVDLLVEPADDIDQTLFRQNDKGSILIPFSNVQSIKDVVVVETGEKTR